MPNTVAVEVIQQVSRPTGTASPGRCAEGSIGAPRRSRPMDTTPRFPGPGRDATDLSRPGPHRASERWS